MADKITESARGEKCTVRLPGHCCFDPETTVFAHLNSIRLGKGMGFKAGPIHGAYCCHACHLVLDGHAPTKIPLWQLKTDFYEAVMETQVRLIVKGLIRC